MSSEFLVAERQEGVCTITLNRPDRHNALCPELLVELKQQLRSLAEGPGMHVVVLRGAGEKAFCSGYDLGSLPTSDSEPTLPPEEPVAEAMESVKRYPYPVIAMIHGYAMGAGLGLATVCDLRIAADTGKFGMPPAKLGVVYAPSGLQDFLNVIGPANTRYMFLSARTVEAQEALHLGLVNQVVPAADLRDVVYGLANAIAAYAPLSLSGMKLILNRLVESSQLSPSEEEEFTALRVRAFNSQDRKEAMAAFQQRRTPKFLGE
ncbi:MAG: enoyl-CoA hydratase [Chloroflexota bacterium]|nr:MAG: enoyl-CoA hydratase [Chloroflexota bacterium]